MISVFTKMSIINHYITKGKLSKFLISEEYIKLCALRMTQYP